MLITRVLCCFLLDLYQSLEDIADRIRCRGLFATHFHELARLCSGRAHLIQPMTMGVHTARAGGGPVLTYKVTPGAADRSYGLEVARLAGVPQSVLARAQAILEDQGHMEPREQF